MPELVWEFYTNYMGRLKNMNFSRKKKYMKKELHMNTIYVRDVEVDISIWAISRDLFREEFISIEETLYVISR